MKPLRMLSLSLFLAMLALLSSCSPKNRFELESPAAGAQVSNLCPQWETLLAERKVMKYDAKNPPNYLDPAGFPVPVTFSWKTTLNPPFTLELSTDPAFTGESTRSILVEDGTTAQVYNLETGRTYYWRVKQNSDVSPVGSFTTAEDFIRQIMISPKGPVNTRDWGGKHIVGGGRTRQGILYRGTEMQHEFTISIAGRKVMTDELRIRTDLDLRYDQQVKGMSTSPIGGSVQWLHYAINAYESFKPERHDEQFPLWRDTMKVFANPDNYPIYFHCYGGVDRTGEVALLLNFLAGVDEEEAFLDYDFSSLANFYRCRTIPYLQAWLKSIAAYAPNESRQVQVEKYLLDLGLTAEEIAAIRKNIVE